MTDKRIYLSPPNIDHYEHDSLKEVLLSGWIAPVGPALKGFESMLEEYFAGKRVLTLNSGTSALHLSLILAGVSDGDEVLVSSFNFAACANVVLYERAIPVFIDSDSETWNLDPKLLEAYLKEAGKTPKALIVTHLYGDPARMEAILAVAEKFGVVVIEDAAEAMGGTYEGKPLGGFGDYGILSFNGNKIMTTGGGGALILDEADYKRALLLATQANVGINEYHHEEAGYNYRMSNVLAGLGLAQFEKLPLFLANKKRINERYRQALSSMIQFKSSGIIGEGNNWLTVGLLKDEKEVLGLINYLEANNVESRRLWKPLHLQPAYRNAEFVGTGCCERLFERGICLPSGTGLTEAEQDWVIELVKGYFNR